MKLHEVLLRASAGKVKWWQAAELMGISPRQMRRWRQRLEEQGHKGLLDQRRGTPSRRRVPKAKAEDNTVRFHNLVMQIERAEWRPTLAGCKVIIHQHLDQTLGYLAVAESMTDIMFVPTSPLHLGGARQLL